MPDIYVSDAVFITENIGWAWHPELNVYEGITLSESFVYAPDRWSINVSELVTIMLDSVGLGFTPKYIDIYDSVAINEVPPAFYYSIDGINIEYISVTEAVTMEKDFSFNDLLRSYPFIQRTITGIIGIEYENGVIQERDIWGRKKKAFEITFPPLTRSEALDVEAFYTKHIGSSFPFTNPVNNITYTIRIVDREFILERRYFNTFFARMVVVEEF
jgi:hypothetical protein